MAAFPVCLGPILPGAIYSYSSPVLLSWACSKLLVTWHPAGVLGSRQDWGSGGWVMDKKCYL